MTMDARMRADLDRYITGDYGERQFRTAGRELQRYRTYPPKAARCELCNRPGRPFIIVTRSTGVTGRNIICNHHARMLGDKWLVFTQEYWRVRNEILG